MTVLKEFKSAALTTFYIFVLITSFLMVAHIARAATVSVKTVRQQAFFQKDPQGLFESLDLKRKVYSFNQKDVAECLQSIKRLPNTLSYTCNVTLPSHSNSRNSKLHEQVSSQSLTVRLNQSTKPVRLTTASDAKSLTLNLDFDATGVDFEWLRMNDDGLLVYNHTASALLKEALLAQRLELLVLEN